MGIAACLSARWTMLFHFLPVGSPKDVMYVTGVSALLQEDLESSNTLRCSIHRAFLY
jgi:hypothetical protein